MSHGKAIARNAAWLMVATTIQKLISFLAFTKVASLLGATVTGRYFIAVSVTSLFVGLADLGLTPVVIREFAQSEEQGRRAFRTAWRLKAILVPIAVLCSLGYGLVRGFDEQLLLAVGLACFVMSADAISLLWYGLLRGKRELRYEALGMMVGQLLSAILSVTLAIMGAGVMGLVFALLCGSAWNLGWSIYQSKRLHLSVAVDQGWDWKRLAKAALPFAIAGLCVKIYSYVDSLLLKQYFGDTVVGYYAAAYKVTYALQFLPLSFVAALYPGMSAAFADRDKQALTRILQGSMRFMLIFGVLFTVGLSGMSEFIVKRFFGPSFSGSFAPMLVLPWVLIPIFLDFPVGSLLNATHRAMSKTKAMIVTMVVNVVANLILVPLYGPLGAAIAGVISFWILFFAGIFFARQDFLPAWRTWLWFFLRGALVAALSWLLVRWLTPDMQIVFAALFTGSIVLIGLFLSRLLLIEDLVRIVSFLRRRPGGAETEVVG